MPKPRLYWATTSTPYPHHRTGPRPWDPCWVIEYGALRYWDPADPTSWEAALQLAQRLRDRG